MEQYEESPPRRWIWLAASLVIVVLVALVVFFLWPSADEEGDSQGSENQNTARDLSIVAGAGGSRLAPDGKTPIGYESTCAGAVEAATNYTRLLSQTSLSLPEGSDKTVEYAVLDEDIESASIRTMGNETLVQSLSKSELNELKDSYRDTFHPEWSGKYLLDSCIPEQSATVGVAGILNSSLPNEREANSYTGRTFNMVWSDGDWKIQSEEMSDAPDASIKTPVLNDVETIENTSTTYVTWEDGEPSIETRSENRPVMNGAALSEAFSVASPGIDSWYNYKDSSQ